MEGQLSQASPIPSKSKSAWSALGVEIRLAAEAVVVERWTVAEFRARQAQAKARRLVRLLQGTMALESEAVDDEALAELEAEQLHALLAGSNRRLWGESA